jgi:hypothetical protein
VKTKVEISAIQLRRVGPQLQVLVESEGIWRLAIDHHDGGGAVSHIAEALGGVSWPVIEPDAPPIVPPDFYYSPSIDPKSCVPCSSCGGMRVENCKDRARHGHEWCDCQ